MSRPSQTPDALVSQKLTNSTTTMTSHSEMLRVRNLDNLVDAFDRHGAVIIPGDIDIETLLDLEKVLLQSPHKQSRHPGGRASYNAPQNAELAGFKSIMASSVLHKALDALTAYSMQGRGVGTSWQYHLCGGDEVDPGNTNYQDLHSDWPSYPTKSMMYGYAIAVSVAPRDIGVEFAPIRLVPWSRLNNCYPVLSAGDSDMFLNGSEVTLRAGEILIRDVRAAHGGTPNLCSTPRCLPGLQVLSPAWVAALRS